MTVVQSLLKAGACRLVCITCCLIEIEVREKEEQEEEEEDVVERPLLQYGHVQIFLIRNRTVPKPRY